MKAARPCRYHQTARSFAAQEAGCPLDHCSVCGGHLDAEGACCATLEAVGEEPSEGDVYIGAKAEHVCVGCGESFESEHKLARHARNGSAACAASDPFSNPIR